MFAKWMQNKENSFYISLYLYWSSISCLFRDDIVLRASAATGRFDAASQRHGHDIQLDREVPSPVHLHSQHDQTCVPRSPQHQSGAHQRAGPAPFNVQFAVPLCRGCGPHRRNSGIYYLFIAVPLHTWMLTAEQVKGARRYIDYVTNSKYALNLLSKCQEENEQFSKFMKQVLPP